MPRGFNSGHSQSLAISIQSHNRTQPHVHVRQLACAIHQQFAVLSTVLSPLFLVFVLCLLQFSVPVQNVTLGGTPCPGDLAIGDRLLVC